MRIVSNINKVITDINASSFNSNLKQYYEILEEIKKFDTGQLDNEQIKEWSSKLSRQARDGILLDDLLVEAFALAREASLRVLGVQPYDTQVLAGIALHLGNLVEMQTGEGKTLAAVLPIYLNALQGKGVHILTFNDYLAKRDAEWMGPIYKFLELTVGFVKEGMCSQERQVAYAADITYVTAKEAGFDYLRDSLCYEKESLVHRPFNFVVVDEADSILIDEARVPLVIAGEVPTKEKDFRRMSEIVRGLKYGEDYDTDQHKRNVHLTEIGVEKVEDILNCGNLYDMENLELLTDINCALHAKALLRLNVDYIIREGKVELIDEFTGRIADNRNWPDGLQAAVEAKEEIKYQSSGRILGSITIQNLLILYPKICGMTATAKASADEFRETYCLDVAIIPPNRPCRRIDHPDLVFSHKEAKYKSIIEEVVRIHKSGRPILIGTASIEESDILAVDLKKAGISCNVLNARNDEMEADIIARAGTFGSVTVSTNMAGRGVDIRLGDGRTEEWHKVANLGGLYVIGTNRHESIRIDNQLRGRAGRQGDPGSSRFFISLEDDLLRRFGIDKLIPQKYHVVKQDEPIESLSIKRNISHIQRVVNGQNFDIRKTLNKYSFILEQQRRIIHKKRWGVLMGSEESYVLYEKDHKLYNSLCKLISVDTLQQLEKHIALFHIDQCWADYLEYIAYIKEGIHLVSIGGDSPLDEFHKCVIKEFEELICTIEKEIINTFKTLDVAKGDFNLEKAGLRSPSATWTYIVNDNYFLNRLSESSKKRERAGYFSMAFVFKWPAQVIRFIYQSLFQSEKGN